MDRLNVLVVSASASLSAGIVRVLQQTGCLEQSRLMGVDNLPETFSEWGSMDLVCVEYRPEWSAAILSFLAPALLQGTPPVFFFIDPYNAAAALQLTNLGGLRVFPFDNLDTLLPDSLEAVFGGRAAAARPVQTGAPLRDLLPVIPIGAAVLRASDGICLDCNQAFAELFAQPREALIGHTMPVLGISAEVAHLYDAEEAPEQAAGLEVERRIYLRSRQVKHILVHLNRFKWDGQPCVLALLHDITAYQRSKENTQRLNDELERLVLARTGALEAANRELAAEISRRKGVEEISGQLEQILWQTPDIVAICDLDGQLHYLNQAGRTMFRINERLPVGEVSVFQAYAPYYQRLIRDEILPYVLKNGIWRGEMQLQTADGKTIPVSQVVLANLEAGQEVQYFASIARDISDYKRIEQELRDSREEYRTLAEAAHDYIFVVDANGMMVYANRYACEALGLDVERVAGMSAARFFPESYSSELLQMIAEVREIDSPVYTEGSFKLGEREYWLGTWLVPVYDSIGKLSNILGISRDITEQRKTDEALKRAFENERQVNQMQSRFFAMTSHQFRTPLNTILLSIELLTKYGNRWDDVQRMEHFQLMEDAARRLSSMLANILMISRVDSGIYQAQHKEFDLVAFCADIVKELSTNDRGEHPLEYVHSTDRILVNTDPELVRYILDNLISNALKYSPKGQPVMVKLGRNHAQVLVEVSDQGIGIPEKDQKRMFQPFQRASNTEAYPGTGLGLTIVKKSIELLNGHVFMKSKEGQGTTFQLRFPDGWGETRH